MSLGQNRVSCQVSLERESTGMEEDGQWVPEQETGIQW